MAAGRGGGDALVRRLGAERTLRWSALVAAVGLAAALGVASPIAGIAGFGLVGLGIANVIPILFSAAGRIAHVQPGMGIAAVATAGYAGFLTGPPVIGFVADLGGIAAGLAIVSVLCAVIACSAGAARAS
jgi:fucose permease